MVFERISLIQIYDALKTVHENEGRVESILINRGVPRGTKTFLRFNDIHHLRRFINENYPYMRWQADCECVTCRESVCNLLNYTIVEPSGRGIFVNNIRKDYESAKQVRMNDLSVKSMRALFNNNLKVVDIYNSYTCFPYVYPQDEYMEFEQSSESCYVEILINKAYTDLIEKLYKPTLRPDFHTISKEPCNISPTNIIEIIEDPCFGFLVKTNLLQFATDPDSSDGSALIRVENCVAGKPISITYVTGNQPVILPPEYAVTSEGITEFILTDLPVGYYTIEVLNDDTGCSSNGQLYVPFGPCSDFEITGYTVYDEGACELLDIVLDTIPVTNLDSNDGGVNIQIIGAVPICEVTITNIDTTEIVFEGQFESLEFEIDGLPAGNYLIETTDLQQCQVFEQFQIFPYEEISNCEGFGILEINVSNEFQA